MTTKDDPVGTEFYSPLKSAEFWFDLMFYCAAGLSIAALLTDKNQLPQLYDVIQCSFALSVIAVFILGLAIRLYWSTRAQEKRCADFLSSAFGVPLIHNTSVNYYNSDQIDPFKRTASAILENSLFSKRISRRMLLVERVKISFYGAAWIIALLHRATDLALLVAVAQVIFSEQVISKWIRLEWVARRFEATYDASYALLQSTTDFRSAEFKARAVQLFALYEVGKAQAGVSLSTAVFKKINRSVSSEWNDISKTLKI